MTGIFDGLPDVFTETFGQAVTIIPVAGASYSIRAVLSRQSDVDPLGDFGTVTARTYLSARAKDVIGLSVDDEIEAPDGTRYRACAPMPDRQGMTQIPLRKEK